MAGYQQCQRCGKGVLVGHNVSHAKNRTRKLQRPNLHPKRVWDEVMGGYRRMRLCTKCIRLYKKEGLTPEVRRPGYSAA